MNVEQRTSEELLPALLEGIENASSDGGNGDHPDDESMALFAGGGLDESERDEIIEHLSCCAVCRKAFSLHLSYIAKPDTVADLLAQAGANDVDTLLRRGGLLLNMGRFGDAVAEFQSAVERDPGYLLGWLGLGQAHQANRDYASAESALRRCLRLQPANADALVRLAIVLEEQAKPSEAVEIWRTLLDSVSTTSPGRRQALEAVDRLKAEPEQER